MRELHPLADVDDIIRDGPCRETYYRTLCEQQSAQIVLETMFTQFNMYFFAGQLPAIQLTAVQELAIAGRLYWETLPMHIVINSEIVLASYEHMRDTVLHEMCHLSIRAINGDCSEISHSHAWITLAERLGVYVYPEYYTEASSGPKSPLR